MCLKGTLKYASAFVVLAAASGSMAFPLLPGTSVSTPGGVADGWTPGAVGALEYDSTPYVSFGGFFHGTFDTAVRLNSVTGFLDFYFRVSNDSTSVDPITRLTAIDFGTVVISDANFRSDLGPGTPPVEATRSASGSVVGFNFDPAGLAPGATSSWMYVSTDASVYYHGSTSLINGDIASLHSYSPVSTPVPEPFTMGLTGSALILALRRWNRGA